MPPTTGLLFGSLPRQAVHLCIDMQLMFTAEGPWPVPWIDKVLPQVGAIAERFPDRTIFTRFMPPAAPEQIPGMWRIFYRHWRHVTREHLDERLVDLIPPLRKLVPPAVLCDRPTYSAFSASPLRNLLHQRHADTLAITGGETDVCVLATILAAIDFGYRVVLIGDALCSSSDQGHDSLLILFAHRYSHQIEVIACDELLRAWPR